ncbi:hypothetical protein LIPSTDRAFT_71111 [Lipomyces starkeyi NRRL Y-11557]|uniref:Uncharacterized protein n=1 Tax=Lipomyces starkeyi NRRL Y-11557 TaxID=675824 RepID=A0A1E3Q5G0_LIPST|nr:hypothetical protein LIPSTDRAFT_71111 [Lipomyces starkeyi NRRL Y-11557]
MAPVNLSDIYTYIPANVVYLQPSIDLIPNGYTITVPTAVLIARMAFGYDLLANNWAFLTLTSVNGILKCPGGSCYLSPKRGVGARKRER